MLFSQVEMAVVRGPVSPFLRLHVSWDHVTKDTCSPRNWQTAPPQPSLLWKTAWKSILKSLPLSRSVHKPLCNRGTGTWGGESPMVHVLQSGSGHVYCLARSKRLISSAPMSCVCERPRSIPLVYIDFAYRMLACIYFGMTPQDFYVRGCECILSNSTYLL